LDDQHSESAPFENTGFEPLLAVMASHRAISSQTQRTIIKQLRTSGFENSDMALLFAQDFVDRPEILASVLMTDFGFPPLLAHQTRTVLSDALRKQYTGKVNTSRMIDQVTSLPEVQPVTENERDTSKANTGSSSNLGLMPQSTNTDQQNQSDRSTNTNTKPTRKPLVNMKQSERRNRSGNQYEYGLPRDYEVLYPTVASEMGDFYGFMTEPSTSNQGEDPIRPATANVYMRHALLFLGWYIGTMKKQNDKVHVDKGPDENWSTNLSIYDIVPSKEKESARLVIDFVMWLRRERQVSASYEANVLRGITKLLKFRFRKESEEGSSAITFVDIPVIQEIRKLHRTAEQKNRNGPRSSDEQKKWLPWSEYLQVIEKTKDEVAQLRRTFEQLDPAEYRYRRRQDDGSTTTTNNNKLDSSSLQKQEVAQAFQRYLILAIFANIPDRQRTIRELELGRTLIRDSSLNCWVIKHGPDDYKTGVSYGDRAPMQLTPEVTIALDEFIEKWRPALFPTTNFLFVQAKTGKPLTGDSVYQRVSQSCYKYTGKRTNPHLLRSMIITHVREVSNASEKDLEALALFMGHSIQMQRSSYDKRTLDQKIAPAVQLLQSINRGANNSSIQ